MPTLLATAVSFVNPDGLRNQSEGGVVQSASWTLYEEVTFDRQVIISRDQSQHAW